jgi:hypothetical protein
VPGDFWRAVLRVWEQIWAGRSEVVLKANSDQSGAFADLFDLADQYVAGRLTLESARPAIRAALEAQMRRE